MRVNLFDLTGRKAVVSGAARGLGLAMAQTLHGHGAEITIVDILDAGETAAEMAKTGAPVHYVKADYTSRESVESAYREAVECMGQVDVLVNNAGTHVRKSIQDHTQEDMDFIVAVNFTSHYWISRLAAADMMGRGYGKIINTCSMLSFFGGFNASTYSATKGAMAQMTKSMSNEWFPHGVACNGIAPGYFNSALNAAMRPDYKQVVLGRLPMGKFGEPEQIGGAVVFLASAASDYVSGAIIPVDGGYMAK